MLFIQLSYSVVFHGTRHQPIALLHLSEYKPHTTHNSSIRSDKGLTLETSAFESLHGGQFTLSTQIKPDINLVPLIWWDVTCTLACSRFSVSEDDRKSERATSGVSCERDSGKARRPSAYWQRAWNRLYVYTSFSRIFLNFRTSQLGNLRA